MEILVGVALFLVLLISIFLIPLGLPGLWIMVAVVGAMVFMGEAAGLTLVLLAILAGVAELVEFLLVTKMSQKYGGGRLTMWGAILGGIAGLFIGVPIPVIGSLVAGLLGTFVGATLGAYKELGGDLDLAKQAGIGALLGRVFAAVVKVGTGIVIFVAAMSAYIF